MGTDEEVVNNDLLKDVRSKITKIYLFQILLFILSVATLGVINLRHLITDEIISIVVNSSLFGLLGCLIYFSRKSYVYLITGKFTKIITGEQDPDINDVDSIKSAIRGYYLYLIFRPFVGLVIGPILFMFVMSGLLTFIKKNIDINNEIARSGRYTIYIISFLGGHASSDLFDWFSKIAKKIVLKESE